MNVMKVEEIPQFVQDVIDLGIETCAIGHRGYCLDDSAFLKNCSMRCSQNNTALCQTTATGRISSSRSTPISAPSTGIWTKTATTYGANPNRGWPDLTLPICFNNHAPRAILILAPWMVVVGAARPIHARRPPP